MKSLAQIKQDNVMTPRDWGSVCEYFVFCNGDFLGCFVKKDHADHFASEIEWATGQTCEVKKPS